MGLITQKKLDDTVDIPVALPAADLKADTWLVVSALGISESDPVIATVRFIQLRILSGVGATVTLYLFKDFNADSSPTLQTPIESISATTGETDSCGNVLNSSQFVARDYDDELTLSLDDPGAGTYAWVVHTTADAKVSVTGSVRVDLNPA